MILDSTQTNDANQLTPVITADVGDNVTLHCFSMGDSKSHTTVWLKKRVGYNPCVMVTVSDQLKYEDGFKLPRFGIEKKKKSCHLKIAHVEPSDEATYYCGFIPSSASSITFRNGTFLSVKGNEHLIFFISIVQHL